MNKTEKTVWTVPALRKLGAIGDVAGSKKVKYNGFNNNRS